MKKRSWLETAEYASLAGSVLGTVAAAIFSQVTYASAPLTLTLLLNLVNRDRFQQQTRQRNTAEIAKLHQIVESLHNQVKVLPAQATDLNPIYQSLSQLNNNAQKFVQRYNARLELEQIQELQEAIAAQPHLQREEIQRLVVAQINESVRDWAVETKAQLALIKPYDYDLVIDRPGSRAMLMQVLEQSQQRLILVCPWIGYGTDSQVIPKLEKLLQRNVRIDIGWGHQNDINDLGNGSGSIRQQLKASGYYSNLPQLEAFEQKYPQQFKLKLLGTHEKFLVCDRSWAMVGSHNFLTSNASSSERELGLKTNDPRIVADLIDRFESARDLEKENKKKKIIG